MNSLSIKELGEDNSHVVYKYLQQSANLNVFNHLAWLNVLKKSYGIKPIFFVAFDFENVCGVFIGYLIHTIKFKKNLHTLKNGVFADSNEIYKEILNFADDYCKNNKISFFLASLGEANPNIHRFNLIVKKNLRISIPDSIENAWSQLKGKERTQIRKAYKDGFVVYDTHENLKSFYKIYAKSMIKKRVSIHPFGLFKNIFSEFGKNAKLITIKKNNKTVAGIILISVNDLTYHPFHACDELYLKHKLNNCLIWESIKYCISIKNLWMYMGEATLHGGVYNFKVSVGGIPQDYFYYSNDFNETNQKKISTNYKSPSFHKNKIKSFFISLINKIPLFFLKFLYIQLRKRSKLL